MLPYLSKQLTRWMRCAARPLDLFYTSIWREAAENIWNENCLSKNEVGGDWMSRLSITLKADKSDVMSTLVPSQGFSLGRFIPSQIPIIYFFFHGGKNRIPTS